MRECRSLTRQLLGALTVMGLWWVCSAASVTLGNCTHQPDSWRRQGQYNKDYETPWAKNLFSPGLEGSKASVDLVTSSWTIGDEGGLGCSGGILPRFRFRIERSPCGQP